MKFVIDESVPRRLARELVLIGLDVSIFPKVWMGLKNGHLLAKIQDRKFDCLVTCDKNFQYQQNMSRWPIALIVLPTPFFKDLKPAIAAIATRLESAEPGKVIEIDRNELGLPPTGRN